MRASLLRILVLFCLSVAVAHAANVVTVTPETFEHGWNQVQRDFTKRGTNYESGVTLVLKDGVYSFAGRKRANLTIVEWAPVLFNMNFPGGYVTIRSESGDPEKCILDGYGAADQVAMIFSRTAALHISGLTFRNFHSDRTSSTVIGENKIEIDNCIFKMCSSSRSGGAVGKGTFKNCHFDNCVSMQDGGAGAVGVGSSFTDCVFERCEAKKNGGALYLAGVFTSYPAITNCTFLKCSADEGAGGAVYVTADARGRVPIVGCTFRENFAPVRAPAERRDTALGWNAFPHSAAIVEEGCVYEGNRCSKYGRQNKPTLSERLTGKGYVDKIVVHPGDDLATVRDRLRAERDPECVAEVIFEDGVYEITNRLELTERDSKTVWRAKNPGKVIIAGGWTFKGGEAKLLSAADPLAKRLPKESIGKVYTTLVPETLQTNFVQHAFCGGMPVLIGNCGDYTGFEPYRKQIWGARYPRHPVFSVDTHMMTSARWPNVDDEELFSPGTNGVVSSDRFKMWSPENDDINVWGFLSDCSYSTGCAAVTNLEADAGIVSIASKEICHKSRIAFFNVLEELDAPNEWYFDRFSGRLVFYPPAGFSAESVCALGVSADAFFRVLGSDITIKGFKFTAKHSHPAVILEGGERNRVESCRFSGLEYEAMFVSGRDCIVTDCAFEELNAAGVRVVGGSAVEGTRGGNVVDNCLFRDFCRMKSSWATGGLILAGGAGNVARHCEIYDSIEHGLDYWGFCHLIEYNRIYDCSYQFQDSGAVYSKGGSVSSGCVIRYNDVSSAPGLVHALYFDDTTSGHVIYGNICRGFGSFGIFIGGGRDNIISNNLVCSPGGIGLRFDERGLFWPSYIGRNLTNMVDSIRRNWRLCDKNSNVVRDYPVFARSFENYEDAFRPINNVWVNNLVIDMGGYFAEAQQANNIRVKEGEFVSDGNVGVRTKGPTGPADRRGPWYLGGVTVIDGTTNAPVDLGFIDIPEIKRVSKHRYEWHSGNFNLKPDAALRTIMPQFEPIAWDEIGRRNGEKE